MIYPFIVAHFVFNVNEKTIFSDKSNERAKSDAKKERRVEEKTVFIIKKDAGVSYEIALHKRPKKGLLSGLWELPNVEGHLSCNEVQEAFPNAEITRIPDGKHIFSHVEWRMWCYEIHLRNEILPESMKEEEKQFFTKETIERELSLPSAFDCCKKYI